MKNTVLLFILCFLFTFSFALTIRETKDFTEKGIESPPISVHCTTTLVNPNLYTGWNLVSVPVFAPQLPNILNTFSNAAGVYEYKDGEYIDAEEIKVNNGYFVNNKITRSEGYCGFPSWEKCFYLEEGWNLIGSYPEKVELSDLIFSSDISSLTFYSYDSLTKKYITASNIEPGKGYWVLNTNTETIKMCPDIEKLNATCIYNCGDIVTEGLHTLCRDIVANDIEVCFNISNTKNVVFDCNNYSITGIDSRDAFSLYNITDSTFKNCFVKDFNAVFVDDTGTNNTYENNILYENNAGIIASYTSKNLNIFNNILWFDTYSSLLDDTRGFVILARGSTISNNKVENYTYGTWVLSLPLLPEEEPNNINYIQNEFINNQYGVYIINGGENIFTGNSICNNNVSDVFSIFPPHRARFYDTLCDTSSPLSFPVSGTSCVYPCS